MNANPDDEAFYAVNQFTDRTEEEFQALLGVQSLLTLPNVPETSEVNENRLKNANWVGHMNGVKDQGSCGSCWAFAGNGVQESAWRIHKATTVTLSEQNLVDCSRNYGNQGCNGGWYFYGWDYSKANGGIALESAYRYAGRDQAC